MTAHGTRVALSDSTGWIRWFERDGFTEVRRVHIGSDIGRRSRGKNYFASTTPGSDGIARKLVTTGSHGGGGTGGGHTDKSGGANENDLVFWTGERLGMVAFTLRAGMTSQDFEEDMEQPWANHEGRALHEREERARLAAEAAYEESLRWGLERQANDLRLARAMGLLH